jgi:hypothetical protein
VYRKQGALLSINIKQWLDINIIKDINRPPRGESGECGPEDLEAESLTNPVNSDYLVTKECRDFHVGAVGLGISQRADWLA